MSSLDELQARHRKELKELQGKITSKKKNATKKSRKGVNDECDRLERDLQERQRAELAALEKPGIEEEVSRLALADSLEREEGEISFRNGNVAEAENTAKEVTSTMQENDESTSSSSRSKKPNRQKARLARRAAEQEADIEAAKAEAAQMPDQRQQELSAMRGEMEKRGLTEIQIRPDGHCLYSAFAETASVNSAKSYKEVRLAAANYMNSHGNDFAPFLEEPLDVYIHKIKDTAEWGGHLELLALAKAFDIKVNVLQATGHVESIEPGSNADKEIWLAYYRHSFGLGEHYNALKKTAAG